MQILIAAYLIMAAAFGAANHDGIIKDETIVSTFEFEANAAQLNGDKLKADFLNGRLEQMNACVEK